MRKTTASTKSELSSKLSSLDLRKMTVEDIDRLTSEDLGHVGKKDLDSLASAAKTAVLDMMREHFERYRRVLERIEEIQGTPEETGTEEEDAEGMHDMKEMASEVQALKQYGCDMVVLRGKAQLILNTDQIASHKKRLADVLRREPENRPYLWRCREAACERTHETPRGMQILDGRIYDCDGDHN